MRDSNSNNGYTVLYGLGCREARIAAGELLGVSVACAEVIIMKSRARVHMVLLMFRYELHFVVSSLGGETLTDEERVFSLIFAEDLSAASLWLVFGLVLLAGLVPTAGLMAGFICEAVLLTDLALEINLT